MAAVKPVKQNIAANRAITASEERGEDVTMPGAMRPMKTLLRAAGGAGRVPGGIKMPHGTGMPKASYGGRAGNPSRKYYGEN